MSHPSGAYLGGVLTVECLRIRSAVDDDGCWHWKCACDKRGQAKVWFAPFGITTTIGPVIGFLRTGSRPKKARWLRKCDSVDCVNPEHWKQASHSEACKLSVRNPALDSLKAAISKRAQSKINEEIAREIREGTEPPGFYAKKHGISLSQAHRIRRHEAWRPLVAHGSSVFEWRP